MKLFLLLLFITSYGSDVYFVLTAWIPNMLNDGMFFLKSPCSIAICVDDVYCNYFSEKNGTYCYYGRSENFTQGSPNSGMYKTRETACPEETLNDTEIKQQFVYPCQYFDTFNFGTIDTSIYTVINMTGEFPNMTVLFQTPSAPRNQFRQLTQFFDIPPTEERSCLVKMYNLGCYGISVDLDSITDNKEYEEPYIFWPCSGYCIMDSDGVHFNHYVAYGC